MFNHNSRPLSGRPIIEQLTPDELALRIRRRRTRRIATILVCTSMVASASYLGWQGVSGKIGANAAIPGEGILNVADLSWPDGSELDALIPAAGGQISDAAPCADNDCGTTKSSTKIALETSLDAMALQQLAMLEPQAGPQGGSSPDQPGSEGGNGGPSGMNWGSGPSFPGSGGGGNGPNYASAPFGSPAPFGGSGPGGGGGGGGDDPVSDGKCDPSNPSDPDCNKSQNAENGGDDSKGGTDGKNGSPNGGTNGTNGGGSGGGGGPTNNLTDPNEGTTCEVNCETQVVDGGTPGGGDGDTTTSVPEPASLALFGAALAALGLSRRRRKQ